MGEWKEKSLGDLCGLITDGKHGDCENQQGSGYFFLSAKDVIDGKLLYENARQITKRDFEETDRRTSLSVGDVVITNSGTIGRMAIAKDDPRTRRTTFQKSVAILRPKKEFVQSEFFYYSLQKESKALIDLAGGTTQQNLLLGDLKEFRIKVPDMDLQRAIASVLSSLDDKIDLLHRQNKTLEAMAGTLFREWFVKDGEAAAKEITLRDIASHGKESISPSRQPDFTFLHYSVPAYDDGKEPKKEFGRHILSNKYCVYSDSILISKLNPRIPRVWPIFGKVDELASICSTEFQVVRPKKKHYFGFIYCFLKSPSVTHELASAVGGTSGSHQRVDPELIFDLTLSQADEKKIEEFASITTPHWLKMNANNCEMRTLTELRDTLLPKLMSGEVRVRN